jgi:type II secretory ATPase GspE/PulE/Tfp pilus assembly ATPase PilB-like protein
VLGDGIGRLFLERYQKHGRILWSQNGVIQSAIETVPLPKFQALLDELKHLTHLPIAPVTQVQQVEIERLYQRDRVLLRLRIMPTETGEQATLQVLRGGALKFYQRQQLTSLSRDALGIARKLQQKMDELHSHTHTATPLMIDQLQPDMVPALNRVLQIVEQQLTDLKQMRDSYTKEG